MKVKEMKAEIEVPDGLEFSVDNNIVTVKGKKGEDKRDFKNPIIAMGKNDKKIVITTKNASKREKTTIGTLKAHIKNMIKGVSEGFTYKLKICSGHFPMNVSVNNNELVTKNFLGESIPRTVKIKEGVSVKVEGDIVIVEGVNKESVGQTAANIEQLTRITNRDRRIFQDGIWITDKNGKEM